MRTRFLFLAGCLLATIMQASAQPLVGATGYTLDYRPGLPTSSCITHIGPANSGGYAYIGGNVENMSLFGLPGLTVRSKNGMDNEDLALVDIVSAYTNAGGSDVCEAMRTSSSGTDNFYLDLRDSSASWVTVYARASMPTTINFSLAHATGMNFPSTNSANDGVIRTFRVDTVLRAYSLSFHDWENRGKVNMYGLAVLDSNVTLTIEQIVFGSHNDTIHGVDTTGVPPQLSYITGRFYKDTNSDCIMQGEENNLLPYHRLLVQAQGQDGSIYYGNSDGDGYYNIQVPTDGMYVLTPSVSSSFDPEAYTFPCASTETIEVGATDTLICCANFALSGDSLFNSLLITGRLYNDSNNDCNAQEWEENLPGTFIIVKATGSHGEQYYAYTDSSGYYTIIVPADGSTYIVTPELTHGIFGQLYSLSCTTSQTVTSDASGGVFCCVDFALRVNQCAVPVVYINSDRRRRCFTSNTYITYTNYGTAAAENTTVKVIYPDYVVPLSSVPMWTSKNGDTLVYEIGTLPGNYSYGSIVIVDSVICGIEEIRGLTQCTKAVISSSTSSCEQANPLWDRSSVAVNGSCNGDKAHFVIYNKGTGNMSIQSPCRLYANDTLIYESTFQLNAGDSLIIDFPANGENLRLEADQCIYHPGQSYPRATVQGCNRTDSTGISSNGLSYIQDDYDPRIAVSCLPILDSYDPNDKQAVPVGFTDEHLIKAAERIHYTIRFQNTGSDVAFNIQVVDTLDVDLDVTTFEEASASHAYTLEVNTVGGKTVLNYMFRNINLKDSTTSEPESHGFLSFSIRSKEGLADGTELSNKADIYFDFNSAIVTNEVKHTIGEFVETDFSKGNRVQIVTGLFDQKGNASSNEANVYPNPATDQVHVALKKDASGTIEITDLSGQLQFTAELNGALSSFSVSSMKTGMYLYKIRNGNGEWIGSGKLLVK